MCVAGMGVEKEGREGEGAGVRKAVSDLFILCGNRLLHCLIPAFPCTPVFLRAQGQREDRPGWMLNLEGEEEGGLVGQGVEGKDEEEGEETLEDRLVAALAAEVVRLGAQEGEGGRPARGVLGRGEYEKVAVLQVLV